MPRVRGPPVIVDPNVRLLKSDPPDIPRPGTRATGPRVVDEKGEGGEGRSPSSQLQFVFALKRNITWWDRVEDSADASCVVLYNVPAVSRIVRYRFDWSHARSIFPSWEEGLALKKCCHLKSRVPPWFRRRRKGYPADSRCLLFRSRSQEEGGRDVDLNCSTCRRFR